MSLIFYKIIAGILIFATSIIAIIYPIKARTHPKHNPLLELADAFASGIFLGAALFHLLPDAAHYFSLTFANNPYPWAELLCATGFLVLLFLERLAQRSNAVPYILALILIIHSLIEGAAIGINTVLSAAAVLFIAIIAHKSSESFALAVILNRGNLTLKRIITIVGLFSLMTPLGIALGATLTQFLQFKVAQLLTAMFNAFAAGTFLYMSTLHHINHHKRLHESEGLCEFLFLMVGLIIMAGLAYWA